MAATRSCACWARGSDGKAAGEPFYRRTLHEGETGEVQIYLGGGDDRVTTLGKANGIEVRVIGGTGRDVVDDTKGGGTRFSSDGGPGELLAGPGSRLDRRKYLPPPPPENAPWIPPRDWGRDTFFIAVALLRQRHRRARGRGRRHAGRSASARTRTRAGTSSARAGPSGRSTFRADYRAEFRSRTGAGTGAGTATPRASRRRASSASATRRATAETRRTTSSSQAAPVRLHAHAGPSPRPRASRFFVGPTIKYGSNRDLDDEHARSTRSSRTATATSERSGRRGSSSSTPGTARRRRAAWPSAASAIPRHGAHVLVRGQVFPGAWDVEETFGSVKGNAALYLSPSSEKAPTLALRAGGQKIFGRYPYFEAAYLGGGLGGFGASAGDDPVRGPARGTVTRATRACTAARTCASTSLASGSSSPGPGACWVSPTWAASTWTGRTRTTGTRATGEGSGSPGSTAATR